MKKHQCCSCEQFFDEDVDDGCPFCGSTNYVLGCIDEPEPDEYIPFENITGNETILEP